MHVALQYGSEQVEIDVPDANVVPVQRGPSAPALEDAAAAVSQALETPLGFPALRRALTPDDHVVVVVDEHLPQLVKLLAPVLEHISAAHVVPEAITLLCPPSPFSQTWIEDLPAEFQDVHCEVHDPTNRRQLSYLATTRRGRRIYLNRTAVDADQLVVLARRGYDPLLGYSGSEGMLYPALSDEETRKEMWARLSPAAPGATTWPVRQEAAEVAWLLGAPFMVQIIEGTGDEVVHVVSGMTDTGTEGVRLLDARWRVQVEQRADVVIAGISGAAQQLDDSDLARALAAAARAVKPNGRIVLLSQGVARVGPALQLARQAENPTEALALLGQQTPGDMATAFQWAKAAERATIYLLSGLPSETAEELFTVPLEHAGQVQRLLGKDALCVFLPEAHKTMAVVKGMGERLRLS